MSIAAAEAKGFPFHASLKIWVMITAWNMRPCPTDREEKMETRAGKSHSPNFLFRLLSWILLRDILTSESWEQTFSHLHWSLLGMFCSRQKTACRCSFMSVQREALGPCGWIRSVSIKIMPWNDRLKFLKWTRSLRTVCRGTSCSRVLFSALPSHRSR